MNRALKQALADAGLSVVDVAVRLEVDPKTVDRWLSGRVPYPRHRAELSDLVDQPEVRLWPEVPQRVRMMRNGSEVQAAYPNRWAVPADLWRQFFDRGEKDLGVLVYSGLFLMEDAAVLRTFAEKARHGARVRLVLGDPDSPYVAARGADEGIGDAMAARIRNALVLLRPLASVPGVEIRTHSTTLYNSIFRADDELLVNMHVYGQPATHSPVLHLVRVEDEGMVATYLESFERVWSEARPTR